MAVSPSNRKPPPRTSTRRASKAGERVNLPTSTKKPNYVDQHVAKRMRIRRVLLGLSQDDLARQIGLTSQQIQKYEACETRVSASRLYDIARRLGVPIVWFFEELNEDKPSDAASLELKTGRTEASSVPELMKRPEAQQLLELFFSITDERLRKKVLEVASVLRMGENQ